MLDGQDSMSIVGDELKTTGIQARWCSLDKDFSVDSRKMDDRMERHIMEAAGSSL